MMAMNWICTKAANNRVEDAAKRTMAITIGNIVANTRPKALEDAAALSMVVMVTDRAMMNSTDVVKSEEQTTNNM